MKELFKNENKLMKRDFKKEYSRKYKDREFGDVIREQIYLKRLEKNKDAVGFLQPVKEQLFVD